MRIRRVLAASAAAAVLAALTACGADDPAPAASPLQSSSDAAPSDDTDDTDGAGDDATSGSDGADDGTGSDDEEAGHGNVDPKELLAAMKAAVAEHETTHLTMDMAASGQAMTAEGDVSYEGDETSMQLLMSGGQAGGGSIELRLVDRMMYMSMPPMTPKGKFLALDLDDPNNPMGDLGGITQGDPMQTFAAFDAGLKKVRHVGRESVDGEEMDHYVLTVDGRKAAKAQGGPMGGPMGMAGMPKKLTYDLWLDDDDLMRRVQYAMPGGPGLSATITMSDWGEPVTVKAPAPGDIMEMPSR